MNLKLKKYIENGNYELALRLINQIIKKENTYENLTLRGIIYLYLKKFEAAIVDLDIVNQKNPGDSDILCNLGIANKGSKNYKKAISYFKDSLVFNPANLNSLLNLTETFIETYEYENALTILKRIIAINPNLERIYQLNAFCYREINRFSLHHDNLIKASQINQNNYENFYHLGFSFIWKNDYDKALECFHLSMKLNPFFTPPLYQINKISKFDTKSNFFKDLKSISINKLSSENRSYLHLTLSDIFFQEQKYDSFFLHLIKANKLKRQSLHPQNYNIDIIQSIFKKISSEAINFNSDYDFIPIFILGMPRSGSSLLEQIISQVEEVYAAGEIPLLHEKFNKLINKSNQYLNKDSLFEIKDSYIKYLSQFPKKNIYIDKLPLNFLWIGFIKLIFPNAKFIYTSRNKADICMSLYRTFFADNVLEFSYDQKEINNFYIMHENMMTFWNSFDLDIHEFNYENFILNPKKELKIIFEKIELEFNENFINTENINRPVKTASFLQTKNKITQPKNPNWSDYKSSIPFFL